MNKRENALISTVAQSYLLESAVHGSNFLFAEFCCPASVSRVLGMFTGNAPYFLPGL